MPCPACGHALQRRPRHAPERLLSWVWPQRRYRRYACPQHTCGWRGLLPGGPARPAGYVPARTLDAARGAAGPAAPPS
ncbi:hypothetical protein IP87_21030 [beta proteobacterium AAP121]|nr:hypothetical protein IP80_13715 [beta proteobacterium AAP65]KPF91363.1 hypothetical protein IP87_21030 [beta proteobacterium AAP121]